MLDYVTFVTNAVLMPEKVVHFQTMENNLTTLSNLDMYSHILRVLMLKFKHPHMVLMLKFKHTHMFRVFMLKFNKKTFNELISKMKPKYCVSTLQMFVKNSA